MIKIIDLFIKNFSFFTDLFLTHLQLSAISIGIAIIVGLIIGIFISEKKIIAGPILAIINLLYTIPSIALLGFLISFSGIGNTTAIIALTLYALLPMVRSTYTGITNIDPLLIEAAKGMGSTDKQILFKIKLPLALPVIMTGIRNMATMTIALAGIASFVGSGGLGVVIYRGITTNNPAMTLIGSLLVALLALIVDFILGMIEKRLTNRKPVSKKLVISSVFITILTVLAITITQLFPTNKPIQIATKPTTEGYILGELIKQTIEAHSNLKTNITKGVGGGTSNIHPAIVKGEFDIYPEYTGTSWQIVLKRKDNYDESKFSILQKEYQKKYNLTWISMFGFNDTYGLGVRKDIAEKYNLQTFSDLARVAKDLTFGAEYDFFEREDGFNALAKTYNLSFKKNIDMDNGLKYKAMQEGKIDVMTVFTTDGQISSSNIVLLKDDQKLYPSYMAGTIIRTDILKKYPQLKTILKKLDNILDEATMSELNNQVETDKKEPEEVARTFLIKKGILTK